jgi:hypothetical protein
MIDAGGAHRLGRADICGGRERTLSFELPSTNLPFAVGFWFALPCRVDAFDKTVLGIAVATLLKPPIYVLPDVGLQLQLGFVYHVALGPNSCLKLLSYSVNF